MTRVAFGPRTTAPSWRWVGLDTARDLEKYFEISLFETFERVPAADLVVIVKVGAPASFVDDVRRHGARLVYLPIDRYESAQQIGADAGFLGACDLVLSHSKPLLHHLDPYCRNVALVEHHSRYALDELADFKQSGFVLWVGGCEHVAHLVKWIDQNGFSADLRLLTNLNNRSARVTAHFRAHEIGVRLRFDKGSINEIAAYPWTESRQRALMRECKAAIDIKGDDFNQATKPPTKAQQFVASGIPFGCNLDSSAAQYFYDCGFELADAADTERLFSRDYWLETRAIAKKLRDWTSLETVGRSYRTAFTKLMSETAMTDLGNQPAICR